MGLRPVTGPRVLGLVAVLVWSNAGAAAQDLNEVVAECVAGGSVALATPCQNTVLAAQALRGGVTLANALGSELTGTFSTLGRRLGRAPRVSLGAHFGVSVFDMPDIRADGPSLAGNTTVVAYGVKATAVAGVLDGFSVLPAVGGVLSLDLLASLDLVLLGEGDGFTGNEGLISVGGRLGLLRESFTMPGVTVSLVRHVGEDLSWGGVDDTGAQVDTDISATSVRATIGKDLFALSLLVGAGLDWQGGDFSVRVADPGVVGGQAYAEARGTSTRRTVYYAGASLTRLVFQFSLEAGWASGLDDLPGYQGGYDPGGIAEFASLAIRLTI